MEPLVMVVGFLFAAAAAPVVAIFIVPLVVLAALTSAAETT